MGNHMSCMSPAASSRLQAASIECRIKFLNCETGAVSELEGPLIAAEAMMEFPAHFLCCFSSAVRSSASSGRRICAVPADEELQAAELYLLLPMHRLNARFSVEELAAFATLDVARKSGGKQAIKGGAANLQSKVAPFPAPASDVMQSSIAWGALELRARSFKRLEGSSLNEEPLMGGSVKQVMCRSKSWMPKLQTVNEYAVVA